MKLKKLLKDFPSLEVKGSKEIEITGISSNSRSVAPGNLFIAKKGLNVDGARYIPEAISAGAAAVLTDFFDPTLKQITQIIHPDIRFIEGKLSAQYNQFPSDDLFMVAITGTNGKTTTSFLIKHLLDQVRGPCGLIGTIEYIMGEHRYLATHTTPDVTTNHKLLREMVVQGCKSAVMEVTSHALDQGRVENIHFDAAIFTNLTPEHLDYHKTMESYCEKKKLLFKGLLKENRKKAETFQTVAIVNCDDPYAGHIVQGCQARVMTYGIEQMADVRAKEIVFNKNGTTFTLEYKGCSFPVFVPLIGRFNVYNTLATIALGISQNIDLEVVIKAVATFPPVAGRLEPVPNGLGLKIYVDFAHTPDALDNVLKCIKELNGGKIYTVFGCGGDRDTLKRPMMARVCEAYSDLSIVTSDNPRSENPEAIIREIVSGFSKVSSFQVVTDRKNAIQKAIEMASPKDIVLIAGRGHEPYQTFARHTIEFDDRKVAFELCQQVKGGLK